MSIDLDFNDIRTRTGERMPPLDGQFLYHSADEIHPKKLVDIGAAGGGSTVILAGIAKKYDGYVWCIDPKPEGRWSMNVEHFDIASYVTLIKKPSPWAAEDIPARPIDFVFIDADSRTSCTLVDLYYFTHLLRIGGRIGIHDICCRNWHGRNAAAWVWRAIRIFQADHKVLVEVERHEGPSGGIIVFEKTGKFNWLSYPDKWCDNDRDQI